MYGGEGKISRRLQIKPRRIWMLLLHGTGPNGSSCIYIVWYTLDMAHTCTEVKAKSAGGSRQMIWVRLLLLLGTGSLGHNAICYTRCWVLASGSLLKHTKLLIHTALYASLVCLCAGCCDLQWALAALHVDTVWFGAGCCDMHWAQHTGQQHTCTWIRCSCSSPLHQGLLLCPIVPLWRRGSYDATWSFSHSRLSCSVPPVLPAQGTMVEQMWHNCIPMYDMYVCMYVCMNVLYV
jgi:hypothetical protein